MQISGGVLQTPVSSTSVPCQCTRIGFRQFLKPWKTYGSSLAKRSKVVKIKGTRDSEAKRCPILVPSCHHHEDPLLEVVRNCHSFSNALFQSSEFVSGLYTCLGP